MNGWLAILTTAALLLAGCTAPPQGYGVGEQSTAALAQQQMEKAAQANQVDPQQTYLHLITQMQQANQWYASLAHTDAFERQYGSSTQIRLLRADALRNTGQARPAEQAYQALLGDADSTTVARARRGLGLLYAGQGQYSQAIAQLELARQLNPIDADVLSDLAYAHMLDGHLAAAQMPILQAGQLAPANARVQLNLALYWLANGERTQAEQLLRRLRQPQAKNAPALIDDSSVQSLQPRLAAIQQAVHARTGSADAAMAVAAQASPSSPTSPMRTIVIGSPPLQASTELQTQAEPPARDADGSQPAKP
ncbi:pilus assembly protein [Comamonas humi]